MYKLSTHLSFSSAHYLNDYEGSCAKIHGHNWKVQIEVSASRLNETGMALDFKDLSDIAWQVIGKYDHRIINELRPFDTINPTAENISCYFYGEIKKLLPAGVNIVKIGLWETEKYLVEYSE